MPLKDDHRERLRRLLTTVEVNPSGNIFELTGEEPHELIHGQGRTLLFRGESHEQLSALTRLLTQPALSQGGHARAAVHKMLLKACDVAQESSVDEAVAWLESQLDQEPRDYVVVQPIALITRDARPLTIGACTIYSSLADAGLPGEPNPLVVKEMEGKVVKTIVRARDEGSAQVIAQHRIDDVTAILIFTDGHTGPWTPGRRIYGPVEGPLMLGSGRPIPLISIVHAIDTQARLWPGIQALSDATAKPDDQRSSWESRAIAATRWYATGARTTWPAQALTAHMTALDCLFVSEGQQRGKGDIVAREVTKRWHLTFLTDRQQRKWLSKLYRSRGKAIHEGRDFLEDAQLEQLSPLVSRAVGWAAFHLMPRHRSWDEQVCRSIDEVFACDEERAREDAK